MPSSRHLLDSDVWPFLSNFPEGGITPQTIAAARAMFADIPVDLTPAIDLTVAERFIPGPAGAPEVKLLIYTPTAAPKPRPLVLYIHGGGYVVGSPEMSDASNRYFARAAGCVIVAVKYRLAPEAVFPAAVEDCYAALKWAHAQAGALGADASRIVVMGESAGGGLAAGLVLLARDRGEIPLAGQILVYPMIDDRTTDRANPHPYIGEFVWNLDSNHFGWTSILGEAPGGPAVSPYAAAARADNLAGLPPAFIAVGALDLFLKEDIDYAYRLMEAGIPTELHVYPGAPHGYHMMPETAAAKIAVRDQLAALRRFVGT